jgi:DNA-binding transcriptional ArsR family regulator
MVEYSAVLDGVFHALSDPTRRGMLAALAAGEQSVSSLAAPHAMSLAAASKHIKVLEAAGLLRREVQGRVHVCQLSPAPLAQASDFLAHYARFWSGRLDALSAFLDAQVKAEADVKKRTRKTPQRRAGTNGNRPSRKERHHGPKR